jgi:hypothetical protein
MVTAQGSFLCSQTGLLSCALWLGLVTDGGHLFHGRISLFIKAPRVGLHLRNLVVHCIRHDRRREARIFKRRYPYH